MITVSCEGRSAQDYVDRYINTNGHDEEDNQYFLGHVHTSDDDSAIIIEDDDCYQPFYEAMKDDFDNDALIPLSRFNDQRFLKPVRGRTGKEGIIRAAKRNRK